ncbi:thioredoxin family protein [Aquimarina spongiae]|uniref:Thioredoxin-like n=1 Tax=Aquimarina spongiae TaxID=570521 RepID=A0A1M6K6K8_9FLAO|nr:thioredoxin family protein [Aquimarina spongiae]SHJ54557.1 Thioredoxin-like [Aquimarina spongiae]
MRSTSTIFFLCFALSFEVAAQNDEAVRWISFEQLDDSLAVKPKKVIISFYADWCAYCKKMDRVVYTKPEVIKKINEEYYAVKMNAESRDTIAFDGGIFTNKTRTSSRNPIHEIPLLLASREGQPFSLPATIFLDESFKVRKRYFEYLSPKKMLLAL